MTETENLEYGRTKRIADAALAVEAAAAKAREMLEQIQMTTWWRLLTLEKRDRDTLI